VIIVFDSGLGFERNGASLIKRSLWGRKRLVGSSTEFTLRILCNMCSFSNSAVSNRAVG